MGNKSPSKYYKSAEYDDIQVSQPSVWLYKQAELCIYGYVRKHYPNFYQVPVDLLKLCLAMYFGRVDEWDSELSDARYNFGENKLATINWIAGQSNACPNAFGETVISEGDILEWKFRIAGKNAGVMHAQNKKAIMIGIIESDAEYDTLQKSFAANSDKHDAYAYYCFNGQMWVNNEQYAGGKFQYISHEDFDLVVTHKMVVMTVDMTGYNGRISFKTGDDSNTIDHGIAYDGIDVNKKYRMAVAMMSEDASIQIIP